MKKYVLLLCEKQKSVVRMKVLMKRVLMVLWVLSMGAVALGQDGRSWALKTGVGGIFTGHVGVEAEVYLGGRWSVALRGAVIRPNLDSLRSPGEGFFLKAGPKMYLSKEGAGALRGLYLKPELVFSHWRDWSSGGYVVNHESWENAVGGVVSVGYNLLLWDRLLVEPHIGFGYVPTLSNVNFYNDQPPYNVIKVRNELLAPDEVRGGVHSHLRLVGGLAVTGGIQVGVKF